MAFVANTAIAAAPMRVDICGVIGTGRWGTPFSQTKRFIVDYRGEHAADASAFGQFRSPNLRG